MEILHETPKFKFILKTKQLRLKTKLELFNNNILYVLDSRYPNADNDITPAHMLLTIKDRCILVYCGTSSTIGLNNGSAKKQTRYPIPGHTYPEKNKEMT